MTEFDPSAKIGIYLTSLPFSDAFKDRVGTGDRGNLTNRDIDQLMVETFEPAIDKLAPPENLVVFNTGLNTLENRLGQIARLGTLGSASFSQITELVDRVEDHILDTKVFPLAFPDRVAKPLGRVTFSGIKTLPIHVSRRLRIGNTGYRRVFSNIAGIEDIGRVPLVMLGAHEAAEGVAKDLRIQAEEEAIRRDEILDSQVGRLARRYGRVMISQVEFGFQYREYLDQLESTTKSVSHIRSNNRAGVINYIRTASRPYDGDIAENVVAQTRQNYLEKVFSKNEN